MTRDNKHFHLREKGKYDNINTSKVGFNEKVRNNKIPVI